MNKQPTTREHVQQSFQAPPNLDDHAQQLAAHTVTEEQRGQRTKAVSDHSTNLSLVVRLKGLLELTQMSRSAAYEAMLDGKLERPIRIGKRSVAWLRSDVLKFIEERVKERDAR